MPQKGLNNITIVLLNYWNQGIDKFERRSIQSNMNQKYPVNFLDKTAHVSMKDLFEPEFGGQ